MNILCTFSLSHIPTGFTANLKSAISPGSGRNSCRHLKRWRSNRLHELEGLNWSKRNLPRHHQAVESLHNHDFLAQNLQKWG